MKTLDNYQHIFIVGIGGAGTVNLATILKRMGKEVTGSEVPNFYLTDKILQDNNISFVTSFEPEIIPENTDLVIYSGSHQGKNNPQVVAAIEKGLETKSLAEMNALLVEYFETSISVCGCHGKTTSTALMSYLLKKIDAHPSHLVGAHTFNGYYGGWYDGKKYFVLESDEYAVNPPQDKTPKFSLLYPKYILCTNIDHDHVDVYPTIEDVKKAFVKFFHNCIDKSPENMLFLCKDDSNIASLLPALPVNQLKTYGFQEGVDLQIVDSSTTEDYSTFKLKFEKKDLGEFTISLFGKHNILNAAGVILVLLHLKFDIEKIRAVIKDFYGADRRFEKKGYENDMYLFDDYGHHPNEIISVINAARLRFPTRRVVTIFEPHTFSRTQALKNEFVDVFSKADQVFLGPIYASARENPKDFTITTEDLIKLAHEKGYSQFHSYAEKGDLMNQLQQNLKKGDVMITFGATEIFKLKDDIIKVMKELWKN